MGDRQSKPYLERNPKKVSPKQNDIRQKMTHVKIVMALTIHESYVSKSNFVKMKTSTNQWSTMTGYFSTLCETELTLK